MALKDKWVDDFTGYANLNAFLAAYPYNPPGDMSTSATGGDTNAHLYMAYGAGHGIGSTPGLENISDPAVGAGSFFVGFDRVFTSPPTCRFMDVELTYDFTGWNPAHSGNQNGNIMEVFSYEIGDRDGSFDGAPIDIVYRVLNHNLGINVCTTAAYANTPLNKVYYQELPGAFPLGARKLRAYLKLSELTETAPGSGQYAPSIDGFAKVYVDDVEVFSFDGPVWHGDRFVGDRTWNSIGIAWGGKIGTRLRVRDSDECGGTGGGGTAPPIATAGEGCGGGSGSGADPSNPTEDATHAPNPYVPPDPLVATCAGDGLVPEGGQGVSGADNWTL